MWRQVSVNCSILYFDATGSIIKHINQQKRPFLYSLVFYDKKNHNILPIAEFVTTKHSQINITQYLISLRVFIELNTKRRFNPRIIVTDQSWALINSVHMAFNNCTTVAYLELCFNVLMSGKKDENYKRTIHYLCSTHILKVIKEFLKQARALNNG
jgi:hypothetical protein